jgi:hypothetical protein
VIEIIVQGENLNTASPVTKDSMWVCADGPLVAIEVALGYPTPLYLRREAGCAPNDNVLVAAEMIAKAMPR